MEQDSQCSERKAEQDGRAADALDCKPAQPNIHCTIKQQACKPLKQADLGFYRVNNNLPTLVNWEGVGVGQHGPLLGGWA